MRFKPGLRARFVAAMLLVVAVSAGGLFYAVTEFVDVLQAELVVNRLAEELDEFASEYQRDPSQPPPGGADLKGYVVRDGQADQLPPELRDLPEGLRDEVRIGEHEYEAGRRDVGAARLYLVLETRPVERLELRLVALAWACGLGAFTLAGALGLVLARLVMRPVTRLAALVTELNPGERNRRLSPHFDDREIGVIAAAFDRFLERVDEFVAREQAFTEDASHELRTPVANVLSAAHLLLEQDGVPPLARERVLRIQRAGEQMHAQIEALLFLAREDGGPPPAPCPLDEIVNAAAAAQRELIAQKALTLNVEAVPVMLAVQPGIAACVVNNLLVNAIHYTERGRIDVKLEPGRLVVQDTGIGIPADEMAHIYERHYRGAQAREAGRGLGLGLYLVKRICDRLGWTVDVRSAPGAGARFEIGFRPRSAGG
jgi:signal transduction histidine kinase